MMMVVMQKAAQDIKEKNKVAESELKVQKEPKNKEERGKRRERSERKREKTKKDKRPKGGDDDDRVGTKAKAKRGDAGGPAKGGTAAGSDGKKGDANEGFFLKTFSTSRHRHSLESRRGG